MDGFFVYGMLINPHDFKFDFKVRHLNLIY